MAKSGEKHPGGGRYIKKWKDVDAVVKEILKPGVKLLGVTKPKYGFVKAKVTKKKHGKTPEAIVWFQRMGDRLTVSDERILKKR